MGLINPARDLRNELQDLQNRMAELAHAINERDAQWRAAQEREAKISALLESASQGIITINEQGMILEVNAMAERLFGYSRHELLESTVEILIPERFRANHLGHRTGYFSEPHTRTMGNGVDLAGRRKDGSEFPVEISLSHIRTNNGSLAVAFISDITERKRAEERAQSEAIIRAVLESAAQGIVGVNSEGLITIVNAMAETLFGYSREELVGQPIKMLIPEGTRASHIKYRNIYMMEPRIRPMVRGLDLTGRRKDGSEFPVEISLSYVETRTGVLAVSLITDTTERKLAEEALGKQTQELARSNADLQQFAYVASHDLQEPLRMITSFAQLLAAQHKGRLGADSDDIIGYIVDGTRRMHALIRDLLLYSQVTNVETRFAPVNLGTAVGWSLQNLELSIKEAEAIVRVGDNLPTVEADPLQLVQLFQNLIGNALKYRSEKRVEVVIGVEQRNGEAVIFVRDNGSGIDSRFHDHIFGIFKRLHHDLDGTGIGLAICKKIVEKSGGRIWVESAAGEGSTFFFTLSGAVKQIETTTQNAAATSAS